MDGTAHPDPLGIAATSPADMPKVSNPYSATIEIVEAGLVYWALIRNEDGAVVADSTETTVEAAETAITDAVMEALTNGN